MKINDLGPEPFSEFDLKHVPDCAEELWYYYQSGDYDGSGHLLVLDKDGTYHLHHCGHCSCYGPLEDLTIASGTGQSLDELEEKCTPEALKEYCLQELIDAAKKTAKKQPWKKKVKK